jgi:alpha-tubulin suppressor-like RCC1 family protein
VGKKAVATSFALIVALFACSDERGAPNITALTADAVSLQFTAVTTGLDHTCALALGGAAFCWGRGRGGSLGADSVQHALKPVRVASSVSFTQISAGEEHTCALASTGILFCWGANTRGQLGTRDASERDQPTQIARPDLRFTRVSAGGYHTCALSPANQALCWGWNTFGQIGNSSTVGILEAVEVHGAFAFSALSSGMAHTCAVTMQGAGYCWGSGTEGQLGDDSRLTRLAAVPVTGFAFATISAGAEHTCAVTATGAAYCWGAGEFGQLGAGAATSATRPVAVAGGHTFAQIAAGSEHTCGVTRAGQLFCWGHNNFGRLGLPGLPTIVAAPARVGADSLRFSAVAAGRLHTCALTSNGSLYCWGFGGFGQLGNGTVNSTSIPTRVILLPADTIRS